MTRTWEIDESQNVKPVDMVLEQDFILRLRRLQRLGTVHLVANLTLSTIPAVVKNHHLLDAIQKSLKEFAKITNGVFADMSNGDAFIIWEETDDAALLVSRLVSVLPVEQGDAHERYLLTYHLPRDYTILRERSNHYIEVARAATSLAIDTPAAALQGAARGPLTAWSVDQIGKLFDDIDVRTYARTQAIFRDAGHAWQPVSEEYFISFDDLRRERFPKLDLITPEHLFLALCEMVDQRLLAALTKNHATIAGRALNLNLAVASVIGGVFTQFTHSVPREQRGLLTFELHRGDLLQDFSRTLNAIDLLHKEGFKVAIDSITPDLLPYIAMGAFAVDQIKINVSGERRAMLADRAIQQALRALPPEKLVFFRCDNDQAVAAGREFGVKLFQGWHIDDLAAQTKI